ncbi:hypothetical protein PR048_017110 [Dryococelus australis]|uniref:Uncharacterized protein n=1 Tax=Dryococelus australis TaxID=614101 RepID=A0ABQ9H8N0_9NEOP|nr:hypothetical protein PR048_017110 [Dryococelus australis]
MGRQLDFYRRGCPCSGHAQILVELFPAIHTTVTVSAPRSSCSLEWLAIPGALTVREMFVSQCDATVTVEMRTMPLVDGFSQGSPVFPALSFRHCSILTSISLIYSQNLAVTSRQNLFTHSAGNTRLIPPGAGMNGGPSTRPRYCYHFTFRLRFNRKRFELLLTAMGVIEVNMERCRNEGAGETGDPRENPPTSGIVLHDVMCQAHNLPSSPRVNCPAVPISPRVIYTVLPFSSCVFCYECRSGYDTIPAAALGIVQAYTRSGARAGIAAGMRAATEDGRHRLATESYVDDRLADPDISAIDMLEGAGTGNEVVDHTDDETSSMLTFPIGNIICSYAAQGSLC